MKRAVNGARSWAGQEPATMGDRLKLEISWGGGLETETNHHLISEQRAAWNTHRRKGKR